MLYFKGREDYKMKRFMFSKVLAILVMCFLAVIWNSVFVYGDVIWEPRDSFYEKERENCVYVNRAYYANGEKGYVTAYKNPESNWAVADFENGNDVYIQFIYKDKSGREWGITEFNDGSEKSGWVLIDELIARYDHNSFCEDHEKEFVDYDGSFDPDSCGDKIIVWEYPGSDAITGKLYKEDFKEYLPEFSYMYKDDEGRQWAYIGYYMGRCGWVCLSDPENENLPVIKVEYEGLIPASKPDRSPAVRNGLWLFIGLAAGIIIVSMVLIKVFYGKKKA
jgi:uncharacterized membrane protein